MKQKGETQGGWRQREPELVGGKAHRQHGCGIEKPHIACRLVRVHIPQRRFVKADEIACVGQS